MEPACPTRTAVAAREVHPRPASLLHLKCQHSCCWFISILCVIKAHVMRHRWRCAEDTTGKSPSGTLDTLGRHMCDRIVVERRKASTREISFARAITTASAHHTFPKAAHALCLFQRERNIHFFTISLSLPLNLSIPFNNEAFLLRL